MMLIPKIVLILIFLNKSFLNAAKNGVPLTPEKLAFAKNFYSNVIAMKDVEKPKKAVSKAGEDEDRSLKASDPDTGSVPLDPIDKVGQKGSRDALARNDKYRPKVGISAGTRFVDDMFFSVFPVGDKYGGIPDTIIGLAKYCVEYAIKGLIALAYTTVRYPHKFLLKGMVAISALSFTATNAAYCLNPISGANFIQKAKIANRNYEEMAKINEEWKIRVANSVDKIHEGSQVQKHGCCAWLEYKRKMVEATPDDAKEFIAKWFASFFKLHQIVFCQQYTDGTPECESVQFIDDEPVRMLPRHMFTLCMELFLKYM